MIRRFAYALSPLAVLIGLIGCSCLLSYGLLLLFGDIQPINKLISRITQILLILSIFPLKKILHLSWPDLGFAPSPLFFKQLAQGWWLSLATLLPVFLTLYALGVHVFDDSRQWTALAISGKLGVAFLLALLIALSEEILFRGLLFTALGRRMAAGLTIAISAFYFSALHFLKSSSTLAYTDLRLNSGFKLMAEAFDNLQNPAIISAFISLFVVGVFLGMLRNRQPHNLGLCIGCHCGWVWQIKVSKDLFNVNPQSGYLYLVSDYDGVIGPLISVWLALAIMAFILMYRRRGL